MIVCLCHRVSDRDVHRAVAGGAHHFERLQDLTRVASNCGNCRDCAQMVFEEACAEHGVGAAPAACAGSCGACAAGAGKAVVQALAVPTTPTTSTLRPVRPVVWAGAAAAAGQPA